MDFNHISAVEFAMLAAVPLPIFLLRLPAASWL